MDPVPVRRMDLVPVQHSMDRDRDRDRGMDPVPVRRMDPVPVQRSMDRDRDRDRDRDFVTRSPATPGFPTQLPSYSRVMDPGSHRVSLTGDARTRDMLLWTVIGVTREAGL